MLIWVKKINIFLGKSSLGRIIEGIDKIDNNGDPQRLYGWYFINKASGGGDPSLVWNDSFVS
jgi:hypothetical protein